MSAADTALLVVDVQGKLITLVPDHRRIIWNIRRLIGRARSAGRDDRGTEQYPQGLGPTVPELAELTEAAIRPKPSSAVARATRSWQDWQAAASARSCSSASKRTFAFSKRPRSAGGRLSGVSGRRCDRCSLRDRLSDVALRAWILPASTLTTTEAALFEWCRAVRHAGVQADQRHGAGKAAG